MSAAGGSWHAWLIRRQIEPSQSHKALQLLSELTIILEGQFSSFQPDATRVAVCDAMRGFAPCLRPLTRRGAHGSVRA